MYSPKETLEITMQVGIKKATNTAGRLMILAIAAGAFIAFASEGSNMAAYNLFSDPSTYGLGKLVAGIVFPIGLVLVLCAGGELFTGNMLMLTAVLDRKICPLRMLRNWIIVFIGNAIGGILIAWMMNASGLFASSAGQLGGVTIKIASYKAGLDFGAALTLGILCNWLVCCAVWMAYSAKSLPGKILAAYLPIWLFITSGFEHSIANFYYVPAGIFAKGNALFAAASGLSAEALSQLSWSSFLLGNLLPVTLGNMIGGLVFVAGFYYFAYREKTL
ncbi:MAG: formate/nitrite transporter family protein [Bacillota bacterium]|nr:formate/nitrite transporter family protein [Bacillota bacterium]